MDGNIRFFVIFYIPDKIYFDWMTNMIPLINNKKNIYKIYRYIFRTGKSILVWKILGKYQKDIEIKDWDILVYRLYIMYYE